MSFRQGFSSPLQPQTSAGGFLTFSPVSVAPGSPAGTPAGRLYSLLSGASFSVLSGALAVNASTGALTTTGTAPSSGVISAKVRVQDGANANAEELTISVPVVAPPPPVGAAVSYQSAAVTYQGAPVTYASGGDLLALLQSDASLLSATNAAIHAYS